MSSYRSKFSHRRAGSVRSEMRQPWTAPWLPHFTSITSQSWASLPNSYKCLWIK
ncbi:hypothetical protein B0H34DRAFT_252831 [Crassisporium funariophilum]|nr:hypothetical protein B0H34DRAFT_252831 [Crassisporium funariophilum]